MSKEFLEVMKEGEALAEVRGRGRRIPQFEEKVNHLIGLIINEKGIRSSMRRALLEEAATTSEFPIIFGTILDRQLLAKYTIARPDWRNYIKVGSQMDFRPQEPIGAFGLQGALNSVPSMAEYKSDAKMGVGNVLINISKFGRRFALGWEVLINDDLGAFSDIAERLANAALRTEFRQATQLIASATGPNAALFGAPITHPIDGKAITNKLTGAGSAFGIAGLTAAIKAFRQLTDADGEPIAVDGWELVAPPALEVAVYQLLRSQFLIMSGGDSTAAVKPTFSPNQNYLSNFNITPHINQYLPIIDVSANKDTTWYLIAKLSNGAAAQLNFLRGHEAPELVMKNPNKLTLGGAIQDPMQGDFESDSIEWRVRHIMGGVQIDPRMAIANVGA